MQKISLLIAAPFILALSAPVVAATSDTSNTSERYLSWYTLQATGFQLSDRQLTRDLNGASVQYLFQYSPKVQLDMALKVAKGGNQAERQEYSRVQLGMNYQLWSMPICACEANVGLSLRAGREKYQGTLTTSQQFYGAGIYSSTRLAPDWYSTSKFGYQDDNAEGALSRRGWYFDYQLSYELSKRADIHLSYQRQKDQHSIGLGFSTRFF